MYFYPTTINIYPCVCAIAAANTVSEHICFYTAHKVSIVYVIYYIAYRYNIVCMSVVFAERLLFLAHR